MRVVASSSHVVSAAPSSSGGGLLTLFPCFGVVFIPWAMICHEIFQQVLPWAAVLHELLQHGFLARGAPL